MMGLIFDFCKKNNSLMYNIMKTIQHEREEAIRLYKKSISTKNRGVIKTGRSYVRKICEKCGGMKTEIIDDGRKDPQTFHKDIDRDCRCD
jgi:hypothetical protein